MRGVDGRDKPGYDMLEAMSDDIPFDKNLELPPDVVDEPVPGVRRVMANNPGPFTFKGTVSYILGRGKVAIVDPGPDDPAHRRRARWT